MSLKKRDLNKIRRSLPKGWKNELSIQLSFSVSLVEKVLLGLRKNELIVHKAIDLCDLPTEIKAVLKLKMTSVNTAQYD